MQSQHSLSSSLVCLPCRNGAYICETEVVCKSEGEMNSPNPQCNYDLPNVSALAIALVLRYQQGFAWTSPPAAGLVPFLGLVLQRSELARQLATDIYFESTKLKSKSLVRGCAPCWSRRMAQPVPRSITWFFSKKVLFAVVYRSYGAHFYPMARLLMTV